MNGSGELVSGAIAGQSATEVARRIETLGLVLVENLAVEEAAPRRSFGLFSQPRAEDVTVFTRDLALLLRAGARVNDGLELLAGDRDIGRLRPVVAEVRSHVLAGETFADALSHHPTLFTPMYVALVRVGEASGSLDQVLEVLAAERGRAEAVRRKISEALRYPAFIFVAAGCVLTFFLTFVLPQFASVLSDLGAKIDPALAIFLSLSTFLRAHVDAIALGLALILTIALASAAPPGGPCRATCRIYPPAARAQGHALLPRATVLPEFGRVAWQRGAFDDRVAHPRRHHGDDGAGRHLERDGGPGASRGQAVRCAFGNRCSAADGGAHVAAW